MKTRGRMEQKRKGLILISNAETAPLIVMRYPGRFHVVSLRDSTQTMAPIDQAKEHCLGVLVRNFDDIKQPMPPYVSPTEEDVRVILDWSKGKKDVLVHCAAGISRSSASAYLIACSRMSPSKALEVLDFNRHWPNPLIVAHGAKLLGNPEVVTMLERWRGAARGWTNASSNRLENFLSAALADDDLAMEVD